MISKFPKGHLIKMRTNFNHFLKIGPRWFVDEISLVIAISNVVTSKPPAVLHAQSAAPSAKGVFGRN